MFQKGGNAVDAACAMLAATCTMWDVLAWGGETQALIYNPNTGKVIAIGVKVRYRDAQQVYDQPQSFAVTYTVHDPEKRMWTP